MNVMNGYTAVMRTYTSYGLHQFWNPSHENRRAEKARQRGHFSRHVLQFSLAVHRSFASGPADNDALRKYYKACGCQAEQYLNVSSLSFLPLTLAMELWGARRMAALISLQSRLRRLVDMGDVPTWWIRPCTMFGVHFQTWCFPRCPPAITGQLEVLSRSLWHSNMAHNHSRQWHRTQKQDTFSANRLIAVGSARRKRTFWRARFRKFWRWRRQQVPLDRTLAHWQCIEVESGGAPCDS